MVAYYLGSGQTATKWYTTESLLIWFIQSTYVPRYRVQQFTV